METRLLIRGEQVEGQGELLAVENPATEETLAELREPSREQLDAAVAGAATTAREWAATPAVERAELLHEVAARLRARTDEVARVMTLEGGKPLVENSDEVGWTAACFDYYAEMGRNFAGRVIPSIESTQLALVVKEPVGVWGCIVPWNYPLLLLSWKDERVGGVAITGSVETGKRVAVLCAERVARVNLEMGGKDPFIAPTWPATSRWPPVAAPGRPT